MRVFLVASIVLASSLGCWPRLSPDTLYGVWKGEARGHGPTLITFIKNNRCELQHYRSKDPSVKVGQWRIQDGKVHAEFEGQPMLRLEIDYTEAGDGYRHERLRDEPNGVVVVKM